MSYMALYRKWRPGEFDEVKGQDHIVRTLKNQIVNDRIGHAYLFCGTRGTGKTTIAKLYAKAVNCEHPVDGSPCNECASCKAIAAGTAMNVIEIDAASNNGVDNIRQIKEEVQYPPTEGKYKVYIIDEVHMLSIGAFNALLKTLEEPPSYVIFILATTEAHKIPITISSRCQKYDFRRISVDTISDRLMDLLSRENIEADRKAVDYIAKAADGSMRDGLSILDQCISFNLGQKLTYDKVLETVGAVDIDIFAKLLRSIIDLDVSAALDIVDETVWQGRELSRFVSDFTWFLRNVLLIKVSVDGDKKLDMTAENIARVEELAEQIDEQTLIRYINIFAGASANIKNATQKRVVLELAVIKLCKPEMETNYDALIDRLRILEKKVESGVVLSADLAEALKSGSVAVAPAGGNGVDAYGTAGTSGTGTGTSGKEKLVDRINNLPEADRYDLKQIIDLWDMVLDKQGRLTADFLRQGTVGLTSDNKGLRITFFKKDEFRSAIRYFTDKDKVKAFKERIAEITGRTFPVEFVVVDDNPETRRETEENDLGKINFDIDII